MASDEQAAMQAAADRLSVKLKAFYHLLPDDEKLVMAYMLKRRATHTRVAGGTMESSFELDIPPPMVPQPPRGDHMEPPAEAKTIHHQGRESE